MDLVTSLPIYGQWRVSPSLETFRVLSVCIQQVKFCDMYYMCVTDEE